MPQVIELPYRPYAKQTEFHRSRADVILFGGAAGPGKSRALREDALELCLRHPNYKATIFRRKHTELEDTHILASQIEFPQELGQYNDQKKRWKFNNGSILKFNHCQLESNVYDYQSAEWDYLGIDELTHFSEDMFWYLQTRNRNVNPNVPAICRTTTNPGGVGHAWVKRIFLNSGCPCAEHRTARPSGTIWEQTWPNPITGKEISLSFQFIQAFLQDNPALLQNDPQYVARLAMQPENVRKALLLGCWDVFAGQGFPEWGDRHIVEPFVLGNNVRRYRAIDWGKTAPFWCGWFAVNEYGRAYLYREVSQPGLRDEEQAELVLEMTGKERIEYTVADPSIYGEGRGSNRWGVTIAQAYQKSGLQVMRADNARILGKQRMHQWLSDAPDGTPWLQVFSTCQSFIKCIKGLVIDDKRVEDIKEGGDDHSYDGSRYWAMSRPAPYVPGIAAPDPYSLGERIKARDLAGAKAQSHNRYRGSAAG